MMAPIGFVISVGVTGSTLDAPSSTPGYPPGDLYGHRAPAAPSLAGRAEAETHLGQSVDSHPPVAAR